MYVNKMSLGNPAKFTHDIPWTYIAPALNVPIFSD